MTSSRPSASVRRLYPAVDRDAGHLERHEELRAEPLRLRQGAARQLAAADAGREPEIVLDPRAGARPARPGACRSSSSVRSPSDAPYTAAARPGGAGADDHEVVDVERGRERSAEPLGHLRAAPGCAARIRPRRTAPAARRRRRPPRRAARARPASRSTSSQRYGNEVARQEVLDRVRPRRPLVPDQPQALRLGQILGLPRVEQVVDDREQAFLGRIPRLRQVVIEVRLVDGLDRRVDVRVRREQDAPRERIDLARPRRAPPSPCMPGMRWSLITIASESPRLFSSRTVVERLLAGAGADDRVVSRGTASAGRAAPRRAPADRRRRRGGRACSRLGLRARRPRRSAATTRNSVRPGCDSTSISPSLWRTSRRTMSRPSPVPCPTGLVVKNGSKMRSRISAGMPGPLSTMRTTTRCRSRLARHLDPAGIGIASSALSIRFAQIWLSSPTKPRTRGRSGSTSTATATDFARAFDLSTATVLPRLCAQVHRLGDRRLVHVREALDRHDEAGDPHRGLLDLRGEAAHRAAGGRPAQRRVERGAARPRRRARRAPRASPRSRRAAPAIAGVEPVIGEPVGDRVLALGLLDRRPHALHARRRRRTSRTRVDRGELRVGQARRAERARRPLGVLQPLLEQRRAALDRGRRVVQLVGQPGRQLARARPSSRRAARST